MRAVERSLRAFVLASVGLWVVAGETAAQAEPARPQLSAAADTNDWSAYFDAGVEHLRQLPLFAGQYFYWASRLAPERAEPLYARWVAFWMVDQERWLGYLSERRDVLRRPEVIRNDSLRYRAYLRNPFVHQGLEVLLYDRLPGKWRSDPSTKGWLAYAEGDLPKAAIRLGQAIAADSVKNRWLRMMRASTLVSMGRLDSALTEMQALLRQLRREDTSAVLRSYQSKEVVLYGIGLLHANRNRSAQARESFHEALAENLAFAPARRSLAALATARRDAAAAVSELAQAVELDPDDAVLHLEYGNALLAAGQTAAAVTEVRAAVVREPWWAEPLYSLGMALEATGEKDSAAVAYRKYLTMAPRNAVMLSTAQSKVRALTQKP